MNKKEYVYPMLIQKGKEDEFIINSPIEELSIVGSANSLGDAVKMARSLLDFALFNLYESNGNFPKLTEKELLEIEKTKKDDEMLIFISTDLDQILNAFGTETIEKWVSIPQYQDFWLREHDVNPSKLLQETIENKIVMA